MKRIICCERLQTFTQYLLASCLALKTEGGHFYMSACKKKYESQTCRELTNCALLHRIHPCSKFPPDKSYHVGFGHPAAALYVKSSFN